MSFMIEEEEQNNVYDRIEDIPLKDKLFDMSSIVNFSKLLSTKKIKNSKVVINEKYYIQIPNHFEQDILEEEECPYEQPDGKKQLSLIEHPDGTAELTRLDEIYYICTFFNISIEIQAEIFRQFLKLKPIYTHDARYLCHYPDFIQVLKDTTKHYIWKEFDRYNLYQKNQINVRDKVCEILLQFTQVYERIFDMQFKYDRLDELEQLVITNRTNEITKEQLEEFRIWRKFNALPITTVNKCFAKKYDVQEVMNAAQIQLYMNNTQNELAFDSSLNIKAVNEELFFNVSQRPLDYKNSDKIYLQIRQNKGYPFLATRNNNEQYISSLCTKYLNDSTCLSLDLDDTIEEFEQVTLNLQNKHYGKYFTFTIKNFLNNIDYKLVESLGYHKLAKYLRERKLYYIDPVTKQEVEINNKNATKGIFFGEAFASDLCSMISQNISTYLYPKYVSDTSYTVKVYHTQHSFLVYLTTQQMILEDFEENEGAVFATRLLEIGSFVLKRFGLEIEPSSVRYYQCKINKSLTLLKLGQSGVFENSIDFPFNNRNLINFITTTKQFTNQQISYLVGLQKSIQENNEQLQTSPYLDVINYIRMRLIKKYVTKSNDVLDFKNEINNIYDSLYPTVQLPCFRNKVPFFN